MQGLFPSLSLVFASRHVDGVAKALALQGTFFSLVKSPSRLPFQFHFPPYEETTTGAVEAQYPNNPSSLLLFGCVTCCGCLLFPTSPLQFCSASIAFLAGRSFAEDDHSPKEKGQESAGRDRNQKGEGQTALSISKLFSSRSIFFPFSTPCIVWKLRRTPFYYTPACGSFSFCTFARPLFSSTKTSLVHLASFSQQL